MLGDDWIDLGLIGPDATTVGSLCYLGKDPSGNRIVLAGVTFPAPAPPPWDGNRIFRSTDAGETWVNLGNIYDNAMDVRHFYNVGNGRVFVGLGIGGWDTTGGAIYESTDWGLTWTQKVVLARSWNSFAKCSGNIWCVGGRRVFLFPHAVVSRSLNGGFSWETVYGTDNYYDAFVGDPYGISDLFYLGGNDLLAAGSRTTGFIYKSNDNGKKNSWIHVFSGAAGASVAHRFCEGADGMIVIGGSNTIYRSIDRGDNWVDLGLGLVVSHIYQIKYLEALEGNLFLGITATGHVIRSLDNGLTWTNLGKKSTADGEGFLCLVHLEDQVLFAGSDAGHLYKSGKLLEFKSPHDLLCEQQKNPTDVTDPQPEFSAVYRYE